MSNQELKYNLVSLFKGDRKIIIPDMQREYCWATTILDHNGGNLVLNFVKGILQDITSPVRLGLIYGYENPENYLQLCDGQQRLTTLYLFCGVLYRYLPDTSEQKEILREILISESEIKDDHEPRLQYAIRESTLFFLRDLVWYYFLQQEGSIQEGSQNIRSQPWFFLEYSLDPTINNILEAIDTISRCIDTEKIEQIIEHIIKIEFLFFDMQNRKYGEEQFVVLNTTGKPLTVTENIKPLLLGKMSGNDLKKYSRMWEEWDQYFWVKRHEKHLTSDAGLNEFFRWFYILKDSQNNPPKDDKNLTGAQKALKSNFFDLFLLGYETSAQIMDSINCYFNAIKCLAENSTILNAFLFKEKCLTEIDCFQFLPVLQYYVDFTPDPNGRSLARVINFFKARAKDDNIRKTTIISVFKAIQIILVLARTKEPDFAKSVNNREHISSEIINKEEVFLLQCFLKSKHRERLEDLIWATQNLDFCRGSVAVLLDCLEVRLDSDELDVDRFEQLKKLIENTFESPTDLLRRALLAMGDYSQYSGETPVLGAHRYSLGKSSREFGVWAKKTEDKVIKTFLKELLALSEVNLDKYMQQKIDCFEQDSSSAWEIARFKIVKNGDIISWMEEKLFAITYTNDKVWALKRQKATDQNSYLLLAPKENNN